MYLGCLEFCVKVFSEKVERRNVLLLNHLQSQHAEAGRKTAIETSTLSQSPARADTSFTLLKCIASR